MENLSYTRIRRKKKDHAKLRIFERFAIILSEQEYKDVSRQIESYENRPVFINPENGKTFNHFKLQGADMVLLYDWEYHCVLTAYRVRWFTKIDKYNWIQKIRYKSKMIRRRNKEVC